MYKSGILTINTFAKGIADSPFQGIPVMQNCEIFESPGALKVAQTLIDYLAPIGANGIPVKKITSSIGDEFILVRKPGTSSLFKNGVNFTNVAGEAWDMIEYEGFIIISSTTGLAAYGTTQTTAYFSNFQTGFTNQYYMKLLVGQDGILYVTNGAYIASLTDLTYVSSSVAPTTTLNLQALKLKYGRYAVTIQELGKNIMVGTQGGSSWSARGAQRVADIFPWNRQPGTLGNPGLADLPIILNECGVHAMLSDGNIMYVVAGTRGNVYKTDGTAVVKMKRIPWTLSKSYNQSIGCYPNSIMMNANNNLLIGISVFSGVAQGIGVYEMSVQGTYPITLKHAISANEIGFLSGNDQDTVFIGYIIGLLSFGVLKTAGSFYNDYSSYFESEIEVVGTDQIRKAFEHCSFVSAKPFANSHGVKVWYRLDGVSDYIDLCEFTYDEIDQLEAKYQMSYTKDAPTEGAVIIQLKVGIKQDNQAAPAPLWDLELLQINLW